jgi:SAM-dependent methyltransferase
MKRKIKDAARSRVLRRMRRLLPDLAPNLMQIGQFWPHDYAADYVLPVPPNGAVSGAAACGELPVPPKPLQAYYCTSAESFVESGRRDVETMRRLLADSGAPIEQAERILDLGCAGGRMIRWMTDLAEHGAEVWGADIWASAILWCQDHLSPPCRFATTTMVPHLPFEDRSFDLVYCGSLFTHIDDLVDAWFLELHRVIKPGGRLYFSINDRHAAEIFSGGGDPDAYPEFYERTGGRAEWDRFVATIEESDDYRRFRDGDAYMVTMGRSMASHVMWDTDQLLRRLDYGYRPHAVTPESYGHQTTVLLERR